MGKVAKFIISSCSRKAGFKNENIARDKANKYGLEYYFCQTCGKFHLTKRKLGKEWEKDYLSK